MASPRRAGNDDGVSLVELIAAVTLLAIAVVAILSALAVLIRSSREHRQMANAQVVLASAAEKVKAGTYLPCTDGLSVLVTGYGTAASAATQPSDWSGASIAVTEVEYWSAGSFVPLTTPCLLDGGLQKVTLQVTSPDGGTTDTVSILKGGVVASGGPIGLTSPCVLYSPTAEFLPNGDYKSTIKVTPDQLETITIHMEPNTCLDRGPLQLSIPGAADLEKAALVPNPVSAQPTFEAKNIRMPPATTPGWETKGNVLTGIIYDSFTIEVGRFWLEVA